MEVESLNHEWEPDWAPVGRREGLLVLAVVLLALALRLWQSGTLGIDHFDEGVYALSGLGLSDPTQPFRLYPGQIRFAPPLYVTLVALSYLIGGPSAQMAILVNVGLGTLTVLLLWVVGRRWFGPSAGLAAAVMLATSEHHILLSRTALTDVGFAFFFVAGLALALEALARERLYWGLFAGLVIGLAWNTKYHGWFALLITGGAMTPVLFFRWRAGRPIAGAVRTWLVMAMAATACYLPWAAFINAQPGGYRALAQYQRTMIDGTWLGNLSRQLEMMRYLDGPWTRISVPLAAAAASLVMPGGVRPALVAGLAFASLLLGGQAAAILLALVGVPLALLRGRGLPAWILTAWIGLWLVSAPIYHPYFRLLLPLHIAAGLGTGLLLSLPQKGTASSPRMWQVMFPWLLTALVALAALRQPEPGSPWRPRDQFAVATRAMAGVIPTGARVVVFGEPAAAFYLQLEGRQAFERTEDPAAIASLPDPVYVVVGRYGRAVPRIRNGLAEFGTRLVPLGGFQAVPSDLRVLDDGRVSQVRSYRQQPDSVYRLAVYRLEPQPRGTQDE